MSVPKMLVTNAIATPTDDGRTEYMMQINRPCTLIVRGPLETPIELMETILADDCESTISFSVLAGEETQTVALPCGKSCEMPRSALVEDEA